MFDGLFPPCPSVEQHWDWAGAAIGFSVAPAWLIVNTAHHCPEPCLLYICRSPTHVKSIDERSEIIGKLGACTELGELPFPGAPPPGPPVGGKTKADATAAIKACAEKKKAMPVWQSASVDPFIGGKKAPSIVKPEREIPADVQGCCCGAATSPE